MTGQEWATLIGAASVAMGTMFGYIKWWVSRIDKREADRLDNARRDRDAELKRITDERQLESVRQDDLRDELRAETKSQMKRLEGIVKSQSKLLASYLRHINKIELMLVRAGMEVPEIETIGIFDTFNQTDDGDEPE